MTNEVIKPINTTETAGWKDAADELLEKYSHLVWYARQKPGEYEEYWSKKPVDIKERAFEAAKEVREQYPEEVKKLGEDDNWHHGFNSGMLAALRFVETACETHTYEDQEFEGEFYDVGGVELALEEFPNIDT